jgi:hypothetical protein
MPIWPRYCFIFCRMTLPEIVLHVPTIRHEVSPPSIVCVALRICFDYAKA